MLTLVSCSKKKSIISEEIVYTEKCPGLDLILIAKFPGYLVLVFQWRDKGGICSTGKAQGMCYGYDLEGPGTANGQHRNYSDGIKFHSPTLASVGKFFGMNH